MSTIVDAGEQAAEAVRQLNCLTLPSDGAPGLEYPADVYGVIADLKVMAQRLPQLLGQLSQWLGGEWKAGHVGHDSGQDARLFVIETMDQLGAATWAAGKLGSALDAAQNACTGLTGITAAERKN